MRWTVAAACLVLAAAPLLMAHEPRYVDGPPPGFTGDFGEPTCASCHVDATVVPDAPGLAIRGVPERFEPGRIYVLTVALHEPEIGAGGFELSARTPGGMQAGTLRAVDARARVVADSTTGVSYIVHTAEGAALVAPDSARWSVEWTAPESSGDSVVFSAAANAANGDDSNFGDQIFTHRATTTRRPTP